MTETKKIIKTETSLSENEAHPATHVAWKYIQSLGEENLKLLETNYCTLGNEGNKIAAIAGETLRRIRGKETTSDRYIMGLAWTIFDTMRKQAEKMNQPNRKQRRASGKKSTIN